MASEKQIAANRRNAAKSTGPKSASGKKIVRMNALKHGLQAEQIVIPGEDPEAFEAQLRGLNEHYQPLGVLEQGLVERIAHYIWRLRRAAVVETAMMRREHWELQRQRAKTEMERAERKMSFISCLLEPDADEDELEDDDESSHHRSLPADDVEALQRDYEKAEEALGLAGDAYDSAQRELDDPSHAVDLAFLGSMNRLEMVSRYETAIERQLRNAMQDLERIQAARKVEAAESATVIDVADLKKEAG